MSQPEGTFPFGQPIRRVVQTDRAPKQLFVLGVYASAVHARWVNVEGKQVVRALGVASEPYIFWNGEEAKEIVSSISIPKEAGRLKPAGRNLNGPSGRSIDEDFLCPLGLTRSDAWLCDLVPHSCMNAGQANAVRGRYEPLAARIGLPEIVWPKVPTVLADDSRRAQIAGELRESNAEIVMTLGDQPLRWFMKAFGGRRSLGDYGRGSETYGRLHSIEIEGRSRHLLPLVHPRQAARLGGHNRIWADLHSGWANDAARRLLA